MKKSTIIFLLLPLFFSCQKNKTTTDPLTEKTNYLTAGVWHLTGYTRRDAFTTTTYAGLPSCKQDDQRSFNSNGTGEANEGPTKCNSTDPQSTPIQWSFVNGYTGLLTISGTEYRVYRLDNTTLDISINTHDPYAPETNYVYTR